jgi:SAM-dependent methyltransferase
MNFSAWDKTTDSYLLSPNKRPYIQLAKQFEGLNGIEIGGPSALFNLKGAFPVYLYAQSVDGVNFSDSTIWEGQISNGDYHYCQHKIGKQFIAEGFDLSFIENKQYDFILSCHSLEHIANPLKALLEWNRVVKIGGRIALVLPDKNFTFDVNRSITKFEHLLEDLNNNTTELDTTHFSEIIELHDLSRDIIDSKEALKNRVEQNEQIRAVHHHVFDFALISQMLNYAGFKIEMQGKYAPFHLITTAVKVADSK